SSLAAALESAELQEPSGQVIISQQLQERAAVVGGEFDIIISKQLREQWEERTEKISLNAIYPTVEGVTGAAEYKTNNFYDNIVKGRAEILDTAGTRLRPTHFFTTADFYGFVTRQTDKTTESRIVTPQFSPGFPLVKNADDFDSWPDPRWARFT